MPILNAIGSSLLAVTASGLTTAINYAASGLVDWALASLFITGGVLGGVVGARSAKALAERRGAAVIVAVAIYMLVRSLKLL